MKPAFRELFLGKREVTLEGNIVFPEGVKWGSITFSKGKGIITRVEKGSTPGNASHGKGMRIILGDGYLFPGFIDLHVHAREDTSQQWAYKETFISAARAALAGGVTAFADMPNTPVPAVDDESYEKKSRLTRFSGMEVLPYAGIGPGTRPLSSKVPYKVFMAKSIGELCFRNEKELRETLNLYRGENVSFHCEDHEVLREHEGREHHRERRPPEAEVRAVELALELIREFELQGKLCHISTKEGVELVRRAMEKDGLPVTMEVTPHHLLLEDNGNGIEFPGLQGTESQWDLDMRVPDGFFQVNPPLRGHDDRKAVFDAFREGRIDFLATDHAPHTLQEKTKGMSGLPHLDSYGNVVGCLLDSGIDPAVIARSVGFLPGEFLSGFGLCGRSLEVGREVHLTYLERGEERIERGGSFSRAGWNPFEGYSFSWKVGFTVIKGRGWKKVHVKEGGYG